MEKIYFRYNPWWEKDYKFEKFVPRSHPLQVMTDFFDSKHIVLLTGIRRVGKTTLLKLFIEFLIKNKGIESKNIFYVSLDDYLLSKKSILEILEDYRTINKLSSSEKCYLFLDEVAYKEDFAQITLKYMHHLQALQF